MNLDPRLKQYATDEQWLSYQAMCEHGSGRKAAKALGLSSESTIRRNIKVMMRKATQQGYNPEYGLIHPIPDGLRSRGPSIKYGPNGEILEYWNKASIAGRDPDEAQKLPDPKKITKISTNYDEQGNVRQQWIAEKPEDIEREKLWEAYADRMAQKVLRVKPHPAPKNLNKDLCACYPVGDQHMGMLAWPKETGAKWDVPIGLQTITDCSNYLMNRTERAEQALIAVLGDFSHYDGFRPETPAHKHLLDADGRFPKMVDAVVDAIRHMIDMALRKHGKVHVIIETGNHDTSSTVYLRKLVAVAYEKEPRVTVDLSPMFYHYFQFGKNLVGTNHGDKAKGERLPLLMAQDQPRMWAETVYRTWWLGHVHHWTVKSFLETAKDHPGCTVETFEVLPPEDAHAHQSGYRSKRGMKAIVLHREFGEIARYQVKPEMFEEK